jgi:hypothetical protein
MTDIENIQMVLSRMAELLRLGGRQDWAAALEKFHNESGTNWSITKGKILSLYGGMGSVNDLILYRNGVLLRAENNELDALRSKLYDLCHG